jgi:heterodisulfide reductase subunit C
MDRTQEAITEVNTAPARKGATEWNVDLFACYQCGKCSNGCPLTFEMDFLPHQLIRMMQLGLMKEVLRSKTIWVCAACETCYTRCPNEIEISKLMDDLKQEALSQRIKPLQEAVLAFHEVFLDNIRRFGRVNETFLMGRFQMQTAWADIKQGRVDIAGINKNIKLGFDMMKKGRLSLLPSWKNRKTVQELFKKEA